MNKTLIVCLMVTLISATAAMAQSRTVSVPESLLTDTQKRLLQADQTVQIASKWVGLGKEVGEAVSSGLQAVTDQAVDLSRTPVGYFIMAMIGWKVVGGDFLQLIIGLPLWIIITILFAWSYRRTCISWRYASKETREGLKVTREYEIHEPETQNLDLTRVLHVVFFLLLTIAMAVATLT